MFGHKALMPDETDAKKIFRASSLENVEESTRSTRMPSGSYYVDEDYPARHEIQ